jgi:hypothetical protein
VRQDEQPRVAIGPGRQGDVIHRLRLDAAWVGASESNCLRHRTNERLRNGTAGGGALAPEPQGDVIDRLSFKGAISLDL